VAADEEVGGMLNLPIAVPQAEIEELCQSYGIRRLALFGSVLRSDFSPESDIDVLVEFEKEARVGWDIVLIEDALAEIFGRDIDLNTPASLSDFFRDRVVASALVLYERA
jgi:predicted nucleotidyltransferase